MGTTRAIDRIRAKLRSADQLGTTKVMLDLADIKEIVQQWEELTQRRAYVSYLENPERKQMIDDRRSESDLA